MLNTPLGRGAVCALLAEGRVAEGRVEGGSGGCGVFGCLRRYGRLKTLWMIASEKDCGSPRPTASLKLSCR